MTSACPAETGNASASPSACAFASRMRSAGSRQNGQSVGLKSLIVALDAFQAPAPDKLAVLRPKLSPQLRVKANVSQVAIITKESPALELLEGHAEHQAQDAALVQLIHRHLARP